jgi:Sec-independent protein translocase protein TatA
MLAFLNNLGLTELVVIAVIAVLIFGKDLPQAASKAYLQARKLRNAVDDLRRDSGIEREIRNIERNMREAEWEMRKLENQTRSELKSVARAEPTETRPTRAPEPPPNPEATAPVEPAAGEPPPGPARDASS